MFKWKKYRALADFTLVSLYGDHPIWKDDIIEVKKKLLGDYQVRHEGLTWWLITPDMLDEYFEVIE